MASFLANLPELLGALVRDPRAFVVVARFDDDRYLQFWVDANGVVVGEVGPRTSSDEVGATVEAMALHDAGWCEPATVPNWHLVADDAGGRARLVSTCRVTVYEVMGERPQDRVRLLSWAVTHGAPRRRGGALA